VRHRQPVKTLAKEDIIGIRYQATASEDEMWRFSAWYNWYNQKPIQIHLQQNQMGYD
jgi:hypothetical protein